MCYCGICRVGHFLDSIPFTMTSLLSLLFIGLFISLVSVSTREMSMVSRLALDLSQFVVFLIAITFGYELIVRISFCLVKRKFI